MVTEIKPVPSLKLYRPTSIIDDWPHRGGRYDGVKVTWLMLDRAEPVGDYHELLGRYREEPRWDGNGKYVVGHDLVDELFTAEEAAQLAEYLKTAHETDLALKEVSLPHPVYARGGVEFMSLSSTPFGGSTELHTLYEYDDYDLPFKVGGYYDLEQQPAPKLVKVLACSHTCEHHPKTDYVPYVKPEPIF